VAAGVDRRGAGRTTGIGMTSARTRRRLIERLRQEGISDEGVLKAIEEVPRHLFLDEALASRAYEDTALPIGFAQTISQPYVVALMSQLVIAGGRPERVLEIGTGCGYQTAVLARLCGKVWSVERIRALMTQTMARMHRLGILNVALRHGDGHAGLPEAAPYDAIVVTAAAPGVPAVLCDQLAIGGRLVIPVGPDGSQELWLVERTAEGLARRSVGTVRFVPLLEGKA